MFKQIFRSSGSYNLNQILPNAKKVTIVYWNAIQCQDIRTFCTPATKKKWDLYSAVCLERHSSIIQPMQEIEKRFHNMLMKIEYENSLKSDHELRKKREEKQKKPSNIDSTDVNIVIQTAQDFEDNAKEEFKNFKFAPTITTFDKRNITSSIRRKLDRKLLLLVQQKVGDLHYWIPPQGIQQEGETMRQTAERALQDTCGEGLKVKFYGNAPIGFYKYKYPKKLFKQGIYGAKVFYFLAKHISGNVTNNVKYQWLDHEELKKVLPNEIQKSILQFIL
ncbi:hypothetical protein P5V15_010009 [Pogonomyrmex californicus]